MDQSTRRLLLNAPSQSKLDGYQQFFNQCGFETIIARSIADAMHVARSEQVAAIIASCSDGAEVAEFGNQFQSSIERSACPIVVFASVSSLDDAVFSLESFAADYVDSTISPRELVARVRAAIRRSFKSVSSPELSVGGLTISAQRCDVEYDGRDVGLTATEFKIIRLLAESVNAVVSRESLSKAAGGDRYDSLDRTIDAHVKNIRKKLGDLGKSIETARGFGYRLRSAGIRS